MNSKEITAFTSKELDISGRTTLGRFGIKSGAGELSHSVTRTPGPPLTVIGKSVNLAAAGRYPIDNTMITLVSSDMPGFLYVRIWDMNEGVPVRMIRTNDSSILCLSKSFDTEYFVTGDAEGRAKVFKMDDGSLRGEFALKGAVKCVYLSDDSRILAAWSDAGTVSLCDMKSGNIFKTLETGFEPWLVSMSSDCGVMLITADNFSRIYDVFSGKLLREFGTQHFGAEGRKKNSPRLVTAGSTLCYVTIEGNEAVLRSVYEDTCVARCRHESKISSYGINTKKTIMTLTSADNRTGVWDMKNITRLNYVNHSRTGGFLLISSSGRHLLSFEDHSGSVLKMDIYNILENRLDASVYSFANGAFDYCVATPPDAASKTGWIRTNRPDALEVSETGENGPRSVVLETDDPRRLEHIKSVSRPDIISARINDYEGYLGMLEEIKHGGKVRSVLNRRNRELKQLQ